MGQNTSTAVMQRRVEPSDSLDYFPTPPWATRALCEELIAMGFGPLDQQSCWEPACGEGHMARALKERFQFVYASDIHQYGNVPALYDFTLGTFNRPGDSPCNPHWIITNPPFNAAQTFTETGLNRAKTGVAMFVRTSFLESETRYSKLFSVAPPLAILQFSERVLLLKHRLVKPGIRNPDTGKPFTTATSYCWIVWKAGTFPKFTQFRWIPPCRKRLERPGDYDLPIASAA